MLILYHKKTGSQLYLELLSETLYNNCIIKKQNSVYHFGCDIFGIKIVKKRLSGNGPADLSSVYDSVGNRRYHGSKYNAPYTL